MTCCTRVQTAVKRIALSATVPWDGPCLYFGLPGWAEIEANDFLVMLVLVIIIAVPFFLYRRR